MLWNKITKTPVYPDGFAQGYFRYYKADGTFEHILALDGKLYKNGVEIPITGLSSFQTTRMIEAVQYMDKLYIATGTKLVTYDGTTAQVIIPYKPEPLEALYIGTNGLADDPDNYLADGTSIVLQINGVKPDNRYGIVNTNNMFTVYVSKPSGDVTEYKMEYRLSDDDTWKVSQAWGTSNRLKLSSTTARDYQLRFVVRKQGTTEEVESMIPRYTVKEVDENKQEDVSTLQQCNRILLHWERIVLYGDPNNKDMIYISDLERPDYIPTLNTLRFENKEQEGLTAVVKFRDSLVAFTPHSIQGLNGRGPEDYSRTFLSSSVGCIAPYSAQVMENYIAFLSLEGVYVLKTLGYSETRANVEKIDSLVDNIVYRDANACAITANGQYQIVFPDRKTRLRYYYVDKVWTKDVSDKLDFSRMYEFQGTVYGLSSSKTAFLKSDPSVWDDDGHVYEDRYVFKDYDFGEPYNPKKLKEMQLLLGQKVYTNLSVSVYADGAPILSPDASYAEINANDEVVWVDKELPNVTIDAGTTLGSWMMGRSGFGNVESSVQKIPISGKCRRVRLEIVHQEATPNAVLGVGFIFKSKKP
jgi:hypothetical protein